ncbi:MAG: hypothetical protein HY645_14195 [Acidobacteria bacterium]|nr:hypothetical protein [Acidobacteriota bacterium]
MFRFAAFYRCEGIRAEDWSVARKISPRIEAWSPHALLLEVTPRDEENLPEPLLCGSSLRWAIASMRTAAYLAAQQTSGIKIPAGKEAPSLADFPIHLLRFENLISLSLPVRLTSEQLELFSHCGVRTLGDLAALPTVALTARLGLWAASLQKLARGEDLQPFQPVIPEPSFEESQELEWTLQMVEPLSFILANLLNRLCARLNEHGLATDRIDLRITVEKGDPEERSLQLAFPTTQPKLLLSLLQLDLQSHPPGNGVTGLALRAQPCPPRIFQFSLLRPPSPHPEKLSRVLAQLETLVGKDRIGTPSLLDTHYPDAFQLHSFLKAPSPKKRTAAKPHPVPKASPCLALRRFRPPRRVQFQPEEVVQRAGPWLSSGEWWTARPGQPGWSHEEWDIELSSGVLYRVFWDHVQSAWFLEGVYD